jgi:molybdate transport system substrate-binding protein
MFSNTLACASLLSLLLAFSPAAHAQGDATLVFAAASLKNALDAAVENYSKTTGKTVTVSYAASSALAKQIEEAAPADIFFSADLEWMDYLQEHSLIATDSRVTLLGNELVLVAPTDSSVSLEIVPGFAFADALAGGKLAMALTSSVPAGKYGKAALESLGVWESVAGSVAEAENVRAALALVSTGEAPLGIVYATDARAEKGVKILGTFPADSHPPILYPVALTAAARAGAKAFLDFLTSAKGNSFFASDGFTIVTPGT